MYDNCILCFIYKSCLKKNVCIDYIYAYYFNIIKHLKKIVSFIISIYLHTSSYHLYQVIVVCSSPKAKTLYKPEPVQTGIQVCPKGIPV